MAQYKVPQDVEAEDKLLGPLTFRQFIYLLIAFALCGLAFLFFQIFPVLVIIPVPFIIFLMVLALPLKKDQPMETYLAAVISYYTKPHKRVWEPGEPESTIVITAPKKVEERRTKDLNGEEASRRLSFLADIVDTEGYAIKGGNSQLSDEINAEASTVEDIFETSQNYHLTQALQSNTDEHHNMLVEQMRQAIDNTHSLSSASATINKFNEPVSTQPTPTQVQSVTVTPTQPSVNTAPINPIAPATTAMPRATLPTPGSIPTGATAPSPIVQPTPVAPPLPTSISEPIETPEPEPESIIVQPTIEVETTPEPEPQPEPEPEPKTEPSQNIIELANNSDFSIETIAQQAKRINEKSDGEVYISLH